MDLLFRNKKSIALLGLILLLILNHNTVVFGLDSDFFGILFSVGLFFIGGRKTNAKVNYWLLGLLIVFEFVSYRLHTKSLHFLSLALLVCLVYYSFTRKFSYVAFICVLLFSSLFNKFFEHLTTEIKQALCHIVFLTLKNFMAIDRIEGVNFYINGAKVTIDTACMGLSMFKTGLLTGALLLTLEEKKQGKYFGMLQIVVFCFIIIILNIVSNYFRIVTLLLLHCTEENVLHHAVGLFCFVLYQVLPMLLIIRYFRPKKPEVVSNEKPSGLWTIVISFAIVLLTSIEMKTPMNQNLLDNLDKKYTVKSGSWVNPEVFKIETSRQLIYIKTPSHKPLICWTGDGYKVVESKLIIRQNEEIWLATLEKNNVRYQSYWWYECDGKKYTSFVEVMLMKLVYNKTVRLINETNKMAIK